MRNKKLLVPLVCQVLIAVFLVINIIAVLVTKRMTMFSYICCHVLAIVQSVDIILTTLTIGKEQKK